MGRWMKVALLLAVACLLSGRSAGAQSPQPGSFPERWIDGTDCTREEVQIHWYNADTAILRQSLCTSFEGPFLYLLFGTEQALLLDTGAGGDRYQVGGRGSGPNLGVAIRATAATSGRRAFPFATAITWRGMIRCGHCQTQGSSLESRRRREIFGFANWTDGMASLDLGGRVLDVIPIPGHEASHIAVYDRLTGLLLTGDTLLSGTPVFPRGDFATYRRSVSRLAGFAASAPVTWVLGAHIEMTSTPKVDFPLQSNEA